MAISKAQMTNKERIEALLRREKPDRIPVWLLAGGFYTLYNGGSIADAYDNPKFSLASTRRTCQDFGCVCVPHFGRPNALAPEFGGEIRMPEGEYAQAPMITRLPVNTVEDVWNLTMPDIKTAGNIPLVLEYFYECFKTSPQEVLDNEPFVLHWSGGLFTNGANIPGLEQMSRWILKNPDAVHRLMRLTTDYYIELAKYWKDTFGTEKVIPSIGEPSTANNIISPKQFEHFVVPYTRELCHALLNTGYKYIHVHICGEQNLNLPYWAQIPFGNPGIISIGHEITLETAARYFPGDIIMGNLEPAIVQTGKPEEVYEAARQVITEAKQIPNGYIFSLGCETPPKAPVQNIEALTQAVNDYGWY
jgi:uroporphyrinogen decarboxylase